MNSDGLTKEQVEQVMVVVNSAMSGVMYNYKKVGEFFYYIEPVYKDERPQPTIKDIKFGRQHFEKIKSTMLKSGLEPSYEIDDFVSMFDAMFDPREISILPIINYLIMEGLIVVAGKSVIIEQ
jgi:hypothetical protein